MLTSEASRVRRPEGANRFVAFTFAASEMVTEVDADGRVTYAAGAFRSRLGAAPEAFIGRPVRDLVAPCDQDALETALVLLQERGRLLPCIMRLANGARAPAVLSGLKLVPERRDSPLCVTFGAPPTPAGAVSQATTAQRLVLAAQARMAGPVPGHVALLELAGGRKGSETLATALERIAPEAVASEVAPGRFGLLDGPGTDMSSVLPMLEAALHRDDGRLVVSSRQVSLDGRGLTPNQATRALRQALATFARDGTAGVEKAGFASGLAAYVQGAMHQATALRKAITQRDFTILYQPIVSLETRRLHHYEALLRPQRAMSTRSPQEFVSLVETVGIADELDMGVAAMVCEAADRSGASCAVNLSGHSVQDAGFRERLLLLLAGSRAAREGRILVEMTETAQIDAMDQVAETASRLRALGVKFCIDDFGAGAADIRLLRAIPTDIVKLDGSFVPGIVGGGRERAFVTAMIEIARAAGAAVVAERIETDAEAEAMALVGAEYGQGWLFGRPAPLPEPPPVRTARRSGSQESWG